MVSSIKKLYKIVGFVKCFLYVFLGAILFYICMLLPLSPTQIHVETLRNNADINVIDIIYVISYLDLLVESLKKLYAFIVSRLNGGEELFNHSFRPFLRLASNDVLNLAIYRIGFVFNRKVLFRRIFQFRISFVVRFIVITQLSQSKIVVAGWAMVELVRTFLLVDSPPHFSLC